MKTQIIKAALFTPGQQGAWGLPILLWGLPGVAKTAVLRQIARLYGFDIEVLSPACRGEGAFGVTPVPVGDRMTYPRPDWTDKFESAKKGIVFVDEINLAAQHYAGALLGLLQDRVLGSYQLPPGVRILGAANPPDIAAASGGWDLSAPAANRVGHVDWPCPDVAAWGRWLFEEDDAQDPIASETEEHRVMSLWPAAWANARGKVRGYLSSRADKLHEMPKNGGHDTSRAWPSPRSWENATRALAGAQVHELDANERDEFVAAFVGKATAAEFFVWYSAAGLPDSEALLDGQVTWKHDARRLDISVAVYSSAVAFCVSTKDQHVRKARAERLWLLLAQAAKTHPDIIVEAAKKLVAARLFSGSTPVAAKLNGILEAAGVAVSGAA